MSNISTAWVFPDPEDPEGEKMILVFLNRGASLEDGDGGTYNHLSRLVNQIRYLFLPIDQVSELTNNALAGRGRSLEAQANYSGDIQKLSDNIAAKISAELADYPNNGHFMYSKK